MKLWIHVKKWSRQEVDGIRNLWRVKAHVSWIESEPRWTFRPKGSRIYIGEQVIMGWWDLRNLCKLQWKWKQWTNELEFNHFIISKQNCQSLSQYIFGTLSLVWRGFHPKRDFSWTLVKFLPLCPSFENRFFCIRPVLFFILQDGGCTWKYWNGIWSKTTSDGAALLHWCRELSRLQWRFW